MKSLMHLLTTILLAFGKMLLPWILERFVGVFTVMLRLVATADNIVDSAARRERVLENFHDIYPSVPDWVANLILEAALILYRLGVGTPQMLEMERLVRETDWYQLHDPMIKNHIIEMFKETFPEVPERAGRLLFELIIAQRRNR